MGLLTFALNVTLDGCNDHREGIADDEMLDYFKEKTPRGILVGSPKLSAALEQLRLIDEYRIVIHPVLAGHGPTLFQSLGRSRRLGLVSTNRLKSGAMALHYRRKEG